MDPETVPCLPSCLALAWAGSQSLPAKAALLHKLDFRRPCSWRLLPLTVAKVKATQAAHGERPDHQSQHCRPAGQQPRGESFQGLTPSGFQEAQAKPKQTRGQAMKRPAAKTCDAPVMKKPAAAPIGPSRATFAGRACPASASGRARGAVEGSLGASVLATG